MKILHLLKTSHGATWALHQIRELIALGLDIHVSLPDDGPMVGKYAQVGATEHLLQTDFPIREPWKVPKRSADIKQLVQNVNPDIIHSHFVGTTLMTRLALGKNHHIPRLFQVPGPLHLEHFFFRQAEIFSAGNADYWMGSCQWTCDRYKKSGINPERIGLAYYGTNTDNFTTHPTGKLRSEIDVDEKIRLVGMVAYMYGPKKYLGQKRGLKGHEDFIDACALCLEQNKNMRCICIGGAWGNAHEYEKLVREYGHKKCGEKIIFLGTRSDVAELYPDLDVVVHPSHSENVGGAVESLLCGIPTIATNIGGFPDLVIDGETGWLVAPKDPNKLATIILDALANPEEAHKKALKGQGLAKKLFDVRFNAKQVLDYYKDLLRHHAKLNK